MSYNYSRRDTLRGGKKKKDKKDKKDKKKKKALKNRRKPAYTVRQPAKKRFSLHSPRTFRNPLQGKQGKRLMKRNPMTRRRKIVPSFHQESVSSSSSYSNIMGKEDFKRNIRGYKNMNGKEAGIEVDQDNNLIRVRRY